MKQSSHVLNRAIVRQAIKESFIKLNPVSLIKNPIMFVVEVGDGFNVNHDNRATNFYRWRDVTTLFIYDFHHFILYRALF